MSKITNDGLTRSGTGCYIAVPIMASVGVKGLSYIFAAHPSVLIDVIVRVMYVRRQLRLIQKSRKQP